MFTNDIIKRGLEEDVGEGDITSIAIIPEALQGRGIVTAKQDLVVAGLGVAGAVFLTLDPRIKIQQSVSDGDFVKKGTPILEVEGLYRDLLKGERSALNFLQRFSGIATLTRKYVERVKEYKTKILDTRKTIPLYRHLDKYAVRMGGGVNHRMGLFDSILIKDNHVSACGGSVEEAISRAKKQFPNQTIIAEVTKPKEVAAAISKGATRLLLDNMTDKEVAESISLAQGKAQIEVSGGITLERVESLAKLGVDFISVGALTHSAPAADLSFEIEPK